MMCVCVLTNIFARYVGAIKCFLGFYAGTMHYIYYIFKQVYMYIKFTFHSYMGQLNHGSFMQKKSSVQ